MGRDAKVSVWVGLKVNDESWDEIKEKLPEGLVDEDGWVEWDEKVKLPLTGGLNVNHFTCCDEVCGFGVEVFSHDWDYGVVAFNASKIQEKVIETVFKVNELFDKCGIQERAGVWCQCDYS